MAGDPSAYAALGLEPSADAAAVDRAYKKLIKQHHPDHEGGDARRAAEINRAYRELRRGPNWEPLEFNEALSPPRLKFGWLLAAALCAIALATALASTTPLERVASRAAKALPGVHPQAAAAPEIMGQPLSLADIDLGTQQAVHLSRTRDEMALAAASRDCLRAFQANPGLKLLDRCAAFDDAAVALQDRDPLRDQGPFAPLEVTGRQWGAATALSNDVLAIDSRLDQIRLRVELALAPPPAPPPPPSSAAAIQRPADASGAPCGADADAEAGAPSGC